MDFMTIMQQRAIKIIEKLPDDKVYYVISILEGIEGLQSEDGDEKLTKSQIAYQNLQHFRKRGSEERDYKEELYATLEEKYSYSIDANTE